MSTRRRPPPASRRPNDRADASGDPDSRGRDLVWYRYTDAATMMDDLAAALSRTLEEAVRERHRASLVLPGGTTPLPLYRRLASRPLDWPRITVLLGDERWVPTDDPASNTGAWKRAVAGTPADGAPTPSFHLPEVARPCEALEEIARRIADAPRPFDVVVLGMGTDGHVASLFPGPGLARHIDQPLVAAPPAPVPPGGGVPRISLGLPLLSDARKLILLIRGDEKRRVLTRALAEEPLEDGLPVARLVARAAARGVPIEIWWASAHEASSGAGR